MRQQCINSYLSLRSVHHPVHFQKLNEPLEASDVPTDCPSWLHSRLDYANPVPGFIRKDGSVELLVADRNE